MALALVAFAPVILGGGFFWDDIDLLIVKNPLIQSSSGLYDFWFTKKNVDYFPLTSTTFWIEWRLWGQWAPPYHLLNVLLHGGSGILLWRVLLRLRAPGAFLAAVLFIIHPVNAESVSWISERKNTLSLFFALASLLIYLRATDERDISLHLAALLLFFLALCAKTAVVMFPLVLLILAWYRTGKVTFSDILHSIPYFALSLMMGLLTIAFQRDNAIATHIIRTDSFATRLATAGCAVWFYLLKLLLPINLIFNYPMWKIDAYGLAGFLPLAALVLVFGLLLIFRNTAVRSILVGGSIYVLLLLPMLGFLDIFYMRFSLVSDHWQYHATPAILACVAAGAAWLYRRVGGLGRVGGIWALRRRITLGTACAIGLALMSYTFHIAWIYRTPESVWRNTLAHNPQSWLAHAQLGTELKLQGKFDEAILQFQDALRIAPNEVDVQESLANGLVADRQWDAGLKMLEEILKKDPTRPRIHNSLGRAYVAMGRADDAISAFRQAITQDSTLSAPHFNLGELLLKKREFTAAGHEFSVAFAIDPNFSEAAYNLGICLASQGEITQSIPYFEDAVRLRPDWTAAKETREHARSDARRQ